MQVINNSQIKTSANFYNLNIYKVILYISIILKKNYSCIACIYFSVIGAHSIFIFYHQRKKLQKIGFLYVLEKLQ